MPTELIAPRIAPMAVIRLRPLAILSRPEFALRGLVIFLAEDFSDNGLEPRPFTQQRINFLPSGCVWGLRLLPAGRADDLAFCLALDVAKRSPLGRLLSD